jgi:two-component system chemotaxis response regulator CheY
MNKPATGLVGITVLLLDDDPNLRQAAGNALRSAGCRDVVQSADGARAPEIIASRAIDLIVFDPRLASLDGMGFLRKLRQMPGCKQLPVIVATTSDSEQDAYVARQLKAVAWLMKPVAPAALMSHVLPALGQPGPQPKSGDCLATLATAYENRLPQKLQDLAQIALRVHEGHRPFAGCCDELLGMIADINGHARLLGYTLMANLGATLHELQVLAVRHPATISPMQTDLIKLLRVGATTMLLLAEKKMLGDGGPAGTMLMEHVHSPMQALLTRFNDAIAAAEAESRMTRDAMAQRKVELETEAWRLQRATTLDERARR